MWELDHKEGWTWKNWYFWTVVLEKTLDSPLDSKEIKLIHPEGIQPWILIERADAEPEASVLWPPDAKSQLIGRDPDDGKDWEQEKKGATEDEMIGWHHWLNGHELEQDLGDGEEQECPACCSSWGCKESDMIDWTTTTTVNAKTTGWKSWGVIISSVVSWDESGGTFWKLAVDWAIFQCKLARTFKLGRLVPREAWGKFLTSSIWEGFLV